jgi:hypothetical protein
MRRWAEAGCWFQAWHVDVEASIDGQREKTIFDLHHGAGRDWIWTWVWYAIRDWRAASISHVGFNCVNTTVLPCPVSGPEICRVLDQVLGLFGLGIVALVELMPSLPCLWTVTGQSLHGPPGLLFFVLQAQVQAQEAFVL